MPLSGIEDGQFELKHMVLHLETVKTESKTIHQPRSASSCLDEMSTPTTPVAEPAQNGRGQNTFVVAKVLDFRRTAVFYLGYRLSKHKMTKYTKNFGGHAPLVSHSLRHRWRTTFLRQLPKRENRAPLKVDVDHDERVSKTTLFETNLMLCDVTYFHISQRSPTECKQLLFLPVRHDFMFVNIRSQSTWSAVQTWCISHTPSSARLTLHSF